MTENDTRRIAILTTGAIRTTTESAIKAMMAAVEAAEEKTREMRQATEQYIADFEKVTNSLADNVDAHVASCQSAIDSFEEHHLKILNGNIAEPTPLKDPVIVEKKPDPATEFDDLKALALSSAKKKDK